MNYTKNILEIDKDFLRRESRERIATAILAAFITNNHVWQDMRIGDEARAAVDLADALLAELDKEPSR